MKGAANKWCPSSCSLRQGYPDPENTQCEQYTEAKFKCRRITSDVSLTLNRPHNEIHDHLNQCMYSTYRLHIMVLFMTCYILLSVVLGSYIKLDLDFLSQNSKLSF